MNPRAINAAGRIVIAVWSLCLPAAALDAPLIMSETALRLDPGVYRVAVNIPSIPAAMIVRAIIQLVPDDGSPSSTLVDTIVHLDIDDCPLTLAQLFDCRQRGTAHIRYASNAKLTAVGKPVVSPPSLNPPARDALFFLSDKQGGFAVPPSKRIAWLDTIAVSASVVPVASLEDSVVAQPAVFSFRTDSDIGLALRTQLAVGIPDSDRAYAVKTTPATALVFYRSERAKLSAFRALSQLIVVSGQTARFIQADIAGLSSVRPVARIDSATTERLLRDERELIEYIGRTDCGLIVATPETETLLSAIQRNLDIAEPTAVTAAHDRIGAGALKLQAGGDDWLSARTVCERFDAPLAPLVDFSAVARRVARSMPDAGRSETLRIEIAMRGYEWTRLGNADILYAGGALQAALTDGRPISPGLDAVIGLSTLDVGSETGLPQLRVKRTEESAIPDGARVVWTCRRRTVGLDAARWPVSLGSESARAAVADALRYFVSATGDPQICLEVPNSLPVTLDYEEQQSMMTIERLWADWLNAIYDGIAADHPGFRLFISGSPAAGSPSARPVLSPSVRSRLRAGVIPLKTDEKKKGK